MSEEKGFSVVALDDLAGLKEPLTKLVKVIAAGMGNLYRPLGIVREADAKAQAIRTIAAAQADAEREFDKLATERQLAALDVIPAIQKRAQMRAEAEAIAQQANLERIAASSTKYIEDEVSDEEVDPDWRTLFFKHARDISDETMREVWAQVLAGEVAKPGTYSLRTLELLRLMSRPDAETFARLCALVFEPGYVVYMSLDKFGLTFDDILRLQAAGLLQESFSLAKTFGHGVGVGKSLLVTHEIGFSAEFARPIEVKALMLTRAGNELRKLITSGPNMAYVEEAKKVFTEAGLRLTPVPIKREGNNVRVGSHQVISISNL